MRVAVAALGFGVVASIAYAVMRIIEKARSASFDPTLIVFDLHTAFYWRATTAAWWGGIAAILLYIAGRNYNETTYARFLRVLELSVIPLSIVLGLAMWWWP